MFDLLAPFFKTIWCNEKKGKSLLIVDKIDIGLSRKILSTN